MIIYKKDNTIRTTLHQSDDSEVKWDISGEEYASVHIVSATYMSFETGDYVILYGQRFTLYSIATPVEKFSTEHFVYNLRFDSLRRGLQNVNFVLFDNTTDGTEPIYVASTTYSIGDKVKYNNVVYQYINTTPASGKTPEEGEWWTVVRTAPIWDFPIVLDPKRFAQMIVDNMNRARPNETWTVGYCIDHSPLQCTFSNTDCLEAATSIASTFETEFWVGNYTINFGKRANTTALTLQYGAEGGFKGITRTEISNTKKVTRLVALGSERNLKGTYRNGSPRLMLPNAYYLDSANIDANNPLEEVVTWDDIYPCMEHAKADYSPTTTYTLGAQVLYNRISWDYIYATPSAGHTPAEGSSYWRMSEGSVTSMVSTLKFIDANLTFNPLDAAYAMSDGTQAKVAFLTGNLAGYELPIQSYDPLTKSITLGTIEDGTDNIIPAKDYTFAYGDQYFFVDIYMPQTYIDKAEQRLLAKANEYLAKYSYDTVAYKGDVSIIWATENAIELHIGDMITVVDTDYGVNDEFRIISLTRNITNPYKYTIELSQLPYIPSRIEDIENAVNDNNDYIDRNGSDKIMFRAHTYKGAKEALDMAFDPEGNYFTDKIKPLIVETSQVLVGSNTQQYQLTGLEFSTLSSNPNHVDWTAGTITDSSMEESARAWNIAAGSFDADVDPLKSYYCYIVCTRATGSLVAEIQFSEDKKTVKFDNTYYYFLLGTLGQKIDGVRQFWTSKGFTFISGDTIVTGRIKNTTGTVDINLTEGKMVIGSGTQKLEFNVDNDGKLKITGTIEAVAGLIAGWAIGTDTISKGNVVLGANGSISCVVGGVTYWTLNPDGSGSVGRGGITWNAAGEVSGSFTTFESDGDLNIGGNIYATGGIVAKSLLPTLPTEWPQAGTGVEGVVKYDGTTLDRNAQGQLYVKTSGGTVVSWGTEVANQSVQLIVSAVTKTLALASHTHTSYQPIDADLTAIAALAGTSGLLKKTAADTWTLDTNTYLTAITKTMVESVLTGNITSHTHSQYLLSSAYTAADVLSKLLTVDGSGSGLDADLLDGLHAAAFLRTFGTINGNIDTDYGEGSVTFDPNPAGTLPVFSYNFRTLNIGNDFTRRTQLAFPYDLDRAYMRRRSYGGWEQWNELYHSGVVNKKTVDWSAKDLSAVNGYYDGAVVAKYLSSTYSQDWPIAGSNVYGTIKYDPATLSLNGNGQLTVIGGGWSNVAWGTVTGQYAQLTVDSVTRNLSLDGHTHSSFLDLELKNIQGGDINHRLELGFTARDYVNWYEYGGLWKFIQKQGTVETELFQINPVNILYKGNTIWHAGNDGTGSGLDADLLDGVNSSGYASALPYPSTSTNNFSIKSGIYSTQDGTTDLPTNGVGNSIVHCNWDVNAANQLFLRYDSDYVAFRRKDGNVWQAWKQFAFTDSNVASATKLANTRTIWGQNFNGEGNVTGNIKLSANEAESLIYNADNSWGCGINMKSSTSTEDRWLRIVRLLTDGTKKTLVHITANDYNSGWVGINTESPSYKLDINGTFRSTGDGYINGNLYVGSASVDRTILTRIISSHDCGVLALNPCGGSVCIGTSNAIEKLYVNGSTKINGYFRVSNDTISAGENEDNGYGFINVCRTASIENASYFSMVRAGTAAFGIGLSTDNAIIIGEAAPDKTINNIHLKLHRDYVTTSKALSSSSRIYTGYDSGLANAISCSNWFRSNGATGWLNATYGAGILSDTANIVRTYSTNKFKVYNTESDSIYTLGGVLANGAVVAKYLSSTYTPDYPIGSGSVFGTFKAGLSLISNAGVLEQRNRHYTTTTSYTDAGARDITAKIALGTGNMTSGTLDQIKLDFAPLTTTFGLTANVIITQTGAGMGLLINFREDAGTGRWYICIYNPTGSTVVRNGIYLSINAKQTV